MNLDHLLRPFSAGEVKQRTTAMGNKVDYLETPTVINRMNEAFLGEWSFKILEHQMLDDVIVVLGELTAAGVTKQQFGTCELNQEGEEGNVFSIGDAMKAAASDALKKCATLFGIGLQLYGAITSDQGTGETTSTDSEPDGASNMYENVSTEEVVSDVEPSYESSPFSTGQANAESEDANEAESLSDATEAPITDMQFAEIVELARRMNFTQAQVDQRAQSRYGKSLAELAGWEADEIIAKLRS
ncbi:MAG: hypothetical protein HOH43_23400 [Candidatus Latescibacteria bacterium]|nr:hypothetical protein [Candidatus Latescibacterota bacterium]